MQAWGNLIRYLEGFYKDVRSDGETERQKSWFLEEIITNNGRNHKIALRHQLSVTLDN